MWYFNMKYGNNCGVGGHFYDREEMFYWFDSHLKYYTFEDEFYDLHIWYEEEKDDLDTPKEDKKFIAPLVIQKNADDRVFLQVTGDEYECMTNGEETIIEKINEIVNTLNKGESK